MTPEQLHVIVEVTQDILRNIFFLITPVVLINILWAIKEQNKFLMEDDEVESIGNNFKP